jgi:hypothetical protein
MIVPLRGPDRLHVLRTKQLREKKSEKSGRKNRGRNFLGFDEVDLMERPMRIELTPEPWQGSRQ